MVTQGGMDEEHEIGIPEDACKHVEVTVQQQHDRRPHWSKMAIVPFLALVLVQFMYAGHTAVSKVALAGGIDPWFFSFYRNVAASLFMAPFAFYLERDVRPEMTWAILGRINLLAFYGIVGNQLFFLAALALISPMVLSAVQNMTPICTFVLAALLGTEKISLRKASDLAKILGTVICIGGAVTLTVYKGVAIFKLSPTEDLDGHSFLHLFNHLDLSTPALQMNSPYALPLGVLCVIGNCCVWAMFLIKQGPVLQKYPALLSMICIMQLIGALQMALAGLAIEGTRFLDFRLGSRDQLIAILYGGMITSGVNLALQSWCVKEVGAFIVSLFNPIQTLMVAFLAILFFGDTLYVGVLIGGVLIIGGFYIVIYAQQTERRRKEALDQKSSYTRAGNVESGTKQSDLKVPLLPE